MPTAKTPTTRLEDHDGRTYEIRTDENGRQTSMRRRDIDAARAYRTLTNIGAIPCTPEEDTRHAAVWDVLDQPC